MSDRYPGGFIKAVPDEPTEYTAPGIWTLEQAAVYKKAGKWPLTSDPNFNQTVLLLHGDGTNGAQNNTFVDSSSNALSISREGNPTQGTFSPFSVAEGQWSNYFDGSGDYLSLASSADFGFGTGDFTIDFFARKDTAWGTAGGTFNIIDSSSNIAIWGGYSDNLSIGLQGASGSAVINTATAGMVANVWYQISVVRSSGVTTGYVNGTAQLSPADTRNYGTTAITIGSGADGGFKGYLSNFRIIKGSPVIPPTGGYTSALTADTNTKLLTCQSNRFVDTNTQVAAKTLTVAGNTSVQPFSPFAPSAAYSASVNGGSGYFDGSTDRLVSLTPSVLNVSTGDFTCECWVYHTSATQQSILNLFNATNNDYTGLTFGFTHMANGSIDMQGASPAVGGGSAAFYLNSAAGSAPINSWNHVALTRNGSTFTLWLNGQSAATYTQSNSLYWTPPNLYIGGSNDSGGSRYTGYIAGLRMVVGAAIYTAPFSVPTAPPTETSQGATASQVELLMNFTNAGIFDNTAKNNLETVGNAQVDTSVVKYGTGSMKFDGTGDYLYRAGTSDFFVANSDFTVECWVYLNSNSGTQCFVNYGGVPWYLAIGDITAEKAQFTWANTTPTNYHATGTTSLATGQWYHLAGVKYGSNIYLYVNGVQEAVTAITGTQRSPSTNAFAIGAFAGGTSPMNGYIDDLRITKGVARYTANFTPPGGPFLNK